MVLSVSDSSIKVMNAALVELGVNTIANFTDNSIAARTGNAKFADVVENVLSLYPWRFARDVLTLANLPSATIPANWETAWQLPTSCLAVHKAFADDVQQTFDVFGRKLVLTCSTSATVTIEATITVDPSVWPGYFRTAFILKLAEALCMPLTQDEGLNAQIAKKAEYELARAKSRDAQGRTPARIDTKGFIRGRRMGRLA